MGITFVAGCVVFASSDSSRLDFGSLSRSDDREAFVLAFLSGAHPIMPNRPGTLLLHAGGQLREDRGKPEL